MPVLSLSIYHKFDEQNPARRRLRLRRETFFSSNLTALRIKDGGIRLFAVGNVFRRLAAKVGCDTVSRAKVA